MKITSLSVPISEGKLSAIRFYAAKKDATIEGEVEDFVQKLYEKYVPRDARELLEEVIGKAATAKPWTKPAKPAPKPGPFGGSGGQ